MNLKKRKTVRSNSNRLIRGFQRIIRYWNPLMRNRVRKEILHDRRVRDTIPMALNIIMFIIVILAMAIYSADKTFFSNPIIILFVLIFLLCAFLIECWYVGGDEYLAIKD